MNILLTVKACGRSMNDYSLGYDVFSFSLTVILESGHSVASSCMEDMVFVQFYLFFLLFYIVHRGYM